MHLLVDDCLRLFVADSTPQNEALLPHPFFKCSLPFQARDPQELLLCQNRSSSVLVALEFGLAFLV